MVVLLAERRSKWILLGFFVWRLINAVATRNFFQADEFWQALEPAHFKAFGYGALTWEWTYGLRSYGFPFILELAYRGVQLISMLSRYWLQDCAAKSIEYYGVIYAPKIVMAAVAALGEFYTVMLVRKLYLLTFDKTSDKKPQDGWNVAKVAITLTLTNFFNCFLITRTFINSFEMCLTSMALYYWDWSGGQDVLESNFTKSLILALFTCLQRPTNGLIWVVLGGYLIWDMASKGYYMKIMFLLAKIVLWFGLITLLTSAIDFYFYGEMIFPPLRFLKFNVVSQLSTFYGANQWHFHITQSLPLMLNYSIPLFLLGLGVAHSQKQGNSKILTQVELVVVFNIFALSLLPHKEFRFIYPLQPLCITISAFGALQLHEKYTIWRFLFVIPLISVMAALVLTWYHESGTISVMKHLHALPTVDSVGFVMPCHSTPWQSYLHRNDIKSLWSITCDPPLHLMNDPDAGKKLPHYMDESDLFYKDTPKYITQNFPPLDHSLEEHSYKHEWPEYLIIFEHLERAFLKKYLENTSYKEECRFFNSLIHWDSRREGDVIVYRKL